MFIFHEGLPRSGKSYEALVHQIVPALKKGRKVFAYIEGLNHAKIAELCEITEDECRALLFQIVREDVPKVYEVVENDSLVILDEMQNFWPSGRLSLGPEITQFVTEHGHRGLDIVGMGQSITDINPLWRKRCERKLQFLKMSMVGMEKKYKWTAYQGVLNERGDIQFQKIKAGTRNYEEKYFGSYASHTSGTDNTDNLEDERLNIFKTPLFRIYLPAALIGCGFAIYYLVGVFDTGIVKVPDKGMQDIERGPDKSLAVPGTMIAQQPVEPPPDTTSIQGAGDLDSLFGQGYRIVLGAHMLETVHGKSRETQLFELKDENDNTLLVFGEKQAADMGVTVAKSKSQLWLGETELGAKVVLTQALGQDLNGQAVQYTRIE